MNAKLNVVRFNNEDVIATSEPLCNLFGFDHFYADGTAIQTDEGVFANGQPYVYIKGTGLVSAFDGLKMPVAEGQIVEPGYYYSTENGTVWVYCPDQAHLQ